MNYAIDMRMTYSIDLREKAMEFLEKGHSMSQAEEAFGISTFTINKWKQKLLKTGSLGQAAFKKLDPEKLKAYVAGHPDTYLKEIGDAFGCSGTAVFKAPKRLKVTRKKTRRFKGQKAELVERHLEEIFALY
jgi:transposase